MKTLMTAMFGVAASGRLFQCDGTGSTHLPKPTFAPHDTGNSHSTSARQVAAQDCTAVSGDADSDTQVESDININGGDADFINGHPGS